MPAVIPSAAPAARISETSVRTIDWDAGGPEAASLCSAARENNVPVLVLLAKPEDAPAAIRAGCHAILLKPFAPNLLAARVGRLTRQAPASPASMRRLLPAYDGVGAAGSNRVWPTVSCPSCSEPGAVSFEFSSHRRMWYACLACDHVWLGPRRE